MKVFLGEKYIEFLPAGEGLPPANDTLYVKYDPYTLRASFEELEEDRVVQRLLIGCDDREAAFAEFRKMFRVIEAAGGLVQNRKGEYLLIFRHQKWDLPKGKLDEGEGPREAALREVQEECGISGLTITHELPSTWHIYGQGGEKILKHTFWYAMNCTDTQPLIPQTEEYITEVKWMSRTEAIKAFETSYGSIREMALGVLRSIR